MEELKVRLDSTEVEQLLQILSSIETEAWGSLIEGDSKIFNKLDAYHLIKGMCLFVIGEQGTNGEKLVISVLQKILKQFSK